MSTQPPPDTALLDALISRGLARNPAAAQEAPPLESYPALPNPDPNSPPPLFGEPPGQGYLYPNDPEQRQAAMISTSPEIVRTQILRAMEVAAQNALLPFAEVDVQKVSDAMLKMAQAYLLIDPTVDAQGVPVGAQQTMGAAQQLAVAHGSPPPPAPAGKPGEAHGTVKPGKTVGGHTSPPKVLPGQAAQLIQTMHEGASDVLKGSRGSRPLPRPRVGA